MEWRRPCSVLLIGLVLLTTASAAGVSVPQALKTADFPTSLSIEAVAGGRGLSAVLYNNGDMNLTNLSWSMTVEGGMVLGRSASGIIPTLASRNATLIRMRHPFGMGTAMLSVVANASGGANASMVRSVRIRGLSCRITPGDPEAVALRLQSVATGLQAPTALVSAADGTGRLFVCEQQGRIRILMNGSLLPFPFLDLTKEVVRLTPVYEERGLLGLAFHPDFRTNGRFFVYYSAAAQNGGNHDNVLAEYSVSGNPNVADPSTARELLRLSWPEFNHNGGTLLFGPDGYLYVSMGDGGGAGDDHGPIGNAQNLANLYGSILRIDVDSGTPYGIPPDNPFVGTNNSAEIYAYGFRNPFRFSFDNDTGRLFCADVGQSSWEEINIVEPGENYGWKIFEGFHPFDLSVAGQLGVNLSDLSFPIFEYSHLVGKAVIGGFVYRGAAIPQLQGDYVFADWSGSLLQPRGALYYLNETENGSFERLEFRCEGRRMLNRFVFSFGVDDDRELYLLTTRLPGPYSRTGQIYKLSPGGTEAS